jgi:predicted amidohydrolase
MFTTGFTMDPGMPEDLDPEGKGATSEWMLAQAKHHDVALAGSVAVRDHEGRAWNRFWWATPEGTLVSYDKHHLFTLAKEAEHYEAGDARIEVEWRGWTFLLQTCYDLRFPGFARNHQHPPYDVAIYVANWPEKRREAWRTLLQARAIENQCFVVGVNRVGVDGSGHRYAGDSMVVDMAGACLADATGDGQAKTIEATLGREKLRAFRKALPFLEDADRFGIFT